MDTNEQITNASKEIASQDEKLTYYIIALCVACVGFSVLRTQDQQATIYHICLAISVLFWLVSIYFGFLALRHNISYQTQVLYFWSAVARIHPGTGKPMPTKFDNTKVIKAARTKSKAFIDKAFDCSKFQKITFYFGIVFFVMWHVIEMTVHR
jgi:uncharacterized membrane protein YtjA (UPF0391 family)